MNKLGRRKLPSITWCLGILLIAAGELRGLVLPAQGAVLEPEEPGDSPGRLVTARYGGVEVTVYRPQGAAGQLIAVANDGRVPVVSLARADGNEIALLTVAGAVRIERALSGFAVTVKKPDGTEIRSTDVRDGSSYVISNGQALDAALQDVLAPASAVIAGLNSLASHRRPEAGLPSEGFEIRAQEITTCELVAVATTTLESTATAAAFPTMGGSLLAGALPGAFFSILWAAVC
ncbi:MAG: hypothetical protein ACK42L_00050 [Thermoanaerobaculum sp.]